MSLSEYQKEQYESLQIVREYFSCSGRAEKERLLDLAKDYLVFRRRVQGFLSEYFGEVCRLKCYQSRLSACCSREGIITFFADVVLNALLSTDERLDRLSATLAQDKPGYKCIYLGSSGCLWNLKPIVCEMFLCDSAKRLVFEKHPKAALEWRKFRSEEKLFKWPDRPVLFDQIENTFMKAGFRSPLMYLNNSPGLLLIKKRAGLA